MSVGVGAGQDRSKQFPTEFEERVMPKAVHPDVPLPTLLLAWAKYRLARFMAGLRPAHSAAGIMALIAREGHPPGG